MIIFASSEIYFWKNEFKATVFIKSEIFEKEISSFISNGQTPIVQIRKNDPELRVIKNLPRRSVIVHLNSDEVYDPELNRKVIAMRSVRAILRSYPIPNVNPLSITHCLVKSSKRVIEGSTFDRFRQKLSLFYFGVGLLCRQMFVKFLESISGKYSIPVPLGYTDLFYEGFTTILALDKNVSIYENLDPKIFPTKDILISFIGQRGNTFRQEVLEKFVKVREAKIKIRNSFGGGFVEGKNSIHRGSEYAEILLRSKFSLCPPGNYSGYTFRFAEAVACRSVPIDFNCVPSDPLYTGQANWLKEFGKFRYPKKIPYLISDFDEVEIGNLANLEFKNFMFELNKAKFDIDLVHG